MTLLRFDYLVYCLVNYVDSTFTKIGSNRGEALHPQPLIIRIRKIGLFVPAFRI